MHDAGAEFVAHRVLLRGGGGDEELVFDVDEVFRVGYSVDVGVCYGVFGFVAGGPFACAGGVSVNPPFSIRGLDLPACELNFGKTRSLRGLVFSLIVFAEVHEPIHTAAEAMREFLDGVLLVVWLSGDAGGLELGVLFAVLVLVLFVPNEVPEAF